MFKSMLFFMLMGFIWKLYRLYDERKYSFDLESCRNRCNQTLLHLLAQDSKISADTLKVLVTYGLNPNSKDAYGRTPLHWAAEKHDIEKVHALLDRGANPAIQDKAGNTIFHIFAWRHRQNEYRYSELLRELSAKYPVASMMVNEQGETYQDDIQSICSRS